MTIYQQVRFWTHRQGGSLVCDSRTYPIETTNSIDFNDLEVIYRTEINYDGRVYFEIFGYSGSDVWKVSK